MAEITTTEGLMVFLMNLFSEKFPQSAILKGGMGLRLLNCPRTTNDLDYMFIPYKSKKEILQGIQAALDSVEGIRYDYAFNSKCLRIRIRYNDLATQIEANVAMECPTAAVSNGDLARKNGFLGRIVQIVSYDVAMANKLAAWNERLLLRDIYDLYFYFSMLRVMPNMPVLRKRLQKVSSTARNKNPREMTIDQLISKLRAYLATLSPKQMIEIADYLPCSELAGLDIKLRTQLLQFCDDLEQEQTE